MSVIIKGFKMPSGCAYCDLNNDSRCSALGMLPDEGNGLTRRKECPLEEFPIGDFISRQAAIDEIVTWTVEDRPDVEMPTDLIDRLRRLPSAEPERKTGKWIAHPGGKFVGFPYMHYECDQCRDFEPEERNFCPNCGAKMEVKHAAD